MLKMKNRLWLFALIVPIMFSLLFPIFSFAEEGVDVKQIEPIGDRSAFTQVQENAIKGALQSEKNLENRTSDTDEYLDMSEIDGSAYIPDTTIADANKWVNEKGRDVYGLFVTIAEPLAIITFVFGLFLMLAGAIAKTSHMVRGFIVMAVAIVVYVGAVFAPELVYFFSSWLAN